MLNAWIKKDDILKLLNDCEIIEGMIDRKGFQVAVSKMKEYKKPKPKPKPKLECKLRINYVDECISRIVDYRNNVKYGIEKDYFSKNLEESTEDLELKKFIMKHFTSGNISKLFVRMNVVPKKYLKDILKVSQRTIQRWEKKEIIEEIGFDLFECYDLSCIEKKFKSLKIR